MPRGADPEDAELFAPRYQPILRAAVAELSWLLDRGYAEASAIALVGNRHALRRRQREAVRRSACADAALAGRLARQADAETVRQRGLAIDGFNRLITLEAALAGAPIFRGRDRLLRDIASVHGSWRRVDTTEAALLRLGQAVTALRPCHVTWYLDRPVSQSGQLAHMIGRQAGALAQSWQVELVFDPDRALRECSEVVATADAAILDAASSWFDPLALALGDASFWHVDLGP